jgi:hypothetical protein
MAEIQVPAGWGLSPLQQTLHIAAGWILKWLHPGSLWDVQRRTGEAVAACSSAAVYALAKAVRKWLSCAM